MELHTHTIGAGSRTIVFLHGVFGQGRNWTQIARGMEDLATCVLVDAPNHGHSPWTDTCDYPTIADLIADFLAHRGLVGPNVTLLGHSMGGKIAMRIAATRPTSIGRLVIVDVSPRPTGLGNIADLVYAMRELDLGSIHERSEAQTAISRRIPDPRIAGFLLQNLTSRRGADGQRHWSWAMNLELLATRLDDIGDWPQLTDGARFEGPTLWIGGGRSNYVTAADSDLMRALFPSLRRIIVKDAGHWVHADAPHLVIDLLRRFVTES